MGQFGSGGGEEGGGECLTMNEKLWCVGGEVKHENLV